MSEIQIFRTGEHCPEITQAILAEIAHRYDHVQHEAPLTIGHPKDDQPAYGWVRSLRASGPELFADISDIDKDVNEQIRAGRLKKISAAFYCPGNPSSPTPDTFALRHIALLGATPPRVKGMAPISFRDTFDETDAGYLVGQPFGDKPMNDNISPRNFAEQVWAYMSQIFKRETDNQHQEGPMANQTPNFSEGNQGLQPPGEGYTPGPKPPAPGQMPPMPPRPNPMPRNSDGTLDISGLPAEVQLAFNELSQREDAIRKAEEEKLLADNVAYAEKQAAEGKILPRDKEMLAASLNALQGQEISFTENGRKVTTSAGDWLKEVFQRQGSQVNFGEVSPDEPPLGTGAQLTGFATPIGTPGEITEIDQRVMPLYQRIKDHGVKRGIAFSEAITEMATGVFTPAQK